MFAVNKADRDGADATARELRHMISLAERAAGAWRPPVVKTVAARGEGIPDLLAAIEKHRTWSLDSGAGVVRRERRAAQEIEALAMATLRSQLNFGQMGELAAGVAGGLLDPYQAADQLVAASANAAIRD